MPRSASKRRTRRPNCAKPIARLTEKVDLPTPPLPLVTATINSESAHFNHNIQGLETSVVQAIRQSADQLGTIGTCLLASYAVGKLLTTDWDTVNANRTAWNNRWTREIER